MLSNSTKTTASARPRSDGSELIPAEVSKNIGNSGQNSFDRPKKDGYTMDDEGIINSYAIEPDEYQASYPAPYQQRRYLLRGAIALVFIGCIVWVAFIVS